MTIFTWNCEGFSRNRHNLNHFIDIFKPSIILLSEPQLLQCDWQLKTSTFNGEYSSSLNSSDLYECEDALVKSRTFGGTMIMWKKEFDPHVTVLPVDTAAFLPILLSPPGITPSVHISVYLPTAGKEGQYIEDLGKLSHCLSEIKNNHPSALIFLRGDFNTSRTNSKRMGLLDYFMTSNNLYDIPICHTTYHHFTGDGASDSHLDRLLVTSSITNVEKINTIICKLKNPLVNSHHDILISTVKIPPVPPKVVLTITDQKLFGRKLV